VQWTEYVASHERQSVDAPARTSKVPTVNRSSERIRRDLSKAGAPQESSGGGAGGGSLFTEAVLVVSQKMKLIEINNEYALYDQAGNEIGAAWSAPSTT